MKHDPIYRFLNASLRGRIRRYPRRVR